MNIQISSYAERHIKAHELMGLYNNAGWWNDRNEKDIKEMLEREISVGAWKGDTLIGFARAVTDGKFRAYIEDVVIHHECQNKGVGTKIIIRIVKGTFPYRYHHFVLRRRVDSILREQYI